MIRNGAIMKTAKNILNEKNYEKFDFEKACNEIETFFLKNKANAKLVLIASSLDDETEDGEHYGFVIYVNGEMADYVTSRDCKKINSSNVDINRDFAIMEVDSSAIAGIIDILKKNKFYVERTSNGVYDVTLL